ncbi:hypothetical protein BZA77DRAFT_357382 [Pyronema omphalodes]|nr:hypothetical protein BZA77DRAFT_357382 [Pyronema omphalodes]
MENSTNLEGSSGTEPISAESSIPSAPSSTIAANDFVISSITVVSPTAVTASAPVNPSTIAIPSQSSLPDSCYRQISSPAPVHGLPVVSAAQKQYILTSIFSPSSLQRDMAVEPYACSAAMPIASQAAKLLAAQSVSNTAEYPAMVPSASLSDGQTAFDTITTLNPDAALAIGSSGPSGPPPAVSSPEVTRIDPEYNATRVFIGDAFWHTIDFAIATDTAGAFDNFGDVSAVGVLLQDWIFNVRFLQYSLPYHRDEVVDRFLGCWGCYACGGGLGMNMSNS